METVSAELKVDGDTAIMRAVLELPVVMMMIDNRDDDDDDDDITDDDGDDDDTSYFDS